MPPEEEVLVRARGLTKRFGGFTAVNAIDFDVRVGEAFGFLGPNGAGKTSTMRMIACASPVSEGELRVLGMSPRTDASRIKARLGVDPQARHVVWERLYQLKRRGATLLLTTHYMDEAERLCDRLVVMDKARIVAEGSPRELIAQHSTREALELRFPDEVRPLSHL